jgi:predicted phage tail component-like protein
LIKENIFSVIFNNSNSKEFDLIVAKRPSIPSPIMKYNEYEVRGKNGKLYEELGYDDIVIQVEFTFVELNQNKWNDQFRKCKKWIRDIKDSKLKFSDDLAYFFNVKKVNITTTSREVVFVGKFTVEFTCEPFMYKSNGQNEIPINASMYNDYELTQPIYRITGEGLLTMVVNGVTIKVNVGQNLTIDTKKGLCYRSDGTINNIALTGNYKDLYLKEGNNTFSWSNGFTIKIVPNWRCL